jgi:hypothetical protein
VPPKVSAMSLSCSRGGGICEELAHRWRSGSANSV